MEDTRDTQLDATRSILVVYTAVYYDQCQGLGVGLVQRVACAKTGKTKTDIMETQKQGVKVGREEFAASKQNPHTRADMLALLKALHLTRATIKKRWPTTAAPTTAAPTTAAPTTVVILLGRPCKEIMEIITHHIEHGPESYKSLQKPHRSTVGQIIKRIHQIRGAGFKVSVNMSDHHDSAVQIAAAQVAERKFKRVCRDARKLATGTTQVRRPAPTNESAGNELAVLTLPIRGKLEANGE